MDEVEIEPLKRYLAPSIIEWLLDEENSTSTFVDNGTNVDEFLDTYLKQNLPYSTANLKRRVLAPANLKLPTKRSSSASWKTTLT